MQILKAYVTTPGSEMFECDPLSAFFLPPDRVLFEVNTEDTLLDRNQVEVLFEQDTRF